VKKKSTDKTRQSYLSNKTKQLWQRPQTDKMAEQSPDTIEVLEEILGLLRITKDNVSNRSIEPTIPETEEMLIVPAPVVYNENI